jgi:hypothetical protein
MEDEHMLRKHAQTQSGSRFVRLSQKLLCWQGMAAIVGATLALGLAADTALGQKRDTPVVHKLKGPTLFVQEYSGDFAQWVYAKTIDAPEDSLFSFQNELANVVGARWQLSSQPMPSDVLSNHFAGFLGSGEFEPPAQGKAKVISVKWKHLVPAVIHPKGDRPDPAGKKYYFRVIADQGARKTPILASNTVAITTKKAKSSIKFTAEGLGLTVKQKHPAMFAASPMPIEIDLQELYIGNDNEDDDEPYLLIAVVYADGTTINPLKMSTSTVRIDSHTKTHSNVPDEDQNGDDLEQGSTAKIPAATGHYEKTIKPIGVEFAADLEDPDGTIGDGMSNGTAVYVVAIALEEDNTTTEAINAARATMIAGLQKKADAIIQGVTLQDLMSGKPPKFDPKKIQDELKGKVVEAAENKTLTTGWWTPVIFQTKIAEISDPDDLVGTATKKFTFGDLLSAGTNGIPFELECSGTADWEGSYTVKGRIRRK